MTTSASAKAAALEGLDFIETEEDVKAVEAATLKIQSTFRGKKFRSKLGGEKKVETPISEEANSNSQSNNKSAGQQTNQQPSSKTATNSSSSSSSSTTKPSITTKPNQPDATKDELSKRMADMEVQDKQRLDGIQNPSGLPEDEAERAATKIQAGFKGYKNLKELEVNVKQPQSNSTGGQQTAPEEK